MEKKALTKDKLVGMTVLDGEGFIIGKVKDVAFTIGRLDLMLIVNTKEGEEEKFAWDEVQAAGDFVILKPKITTPATPATPTCPTCGQPLTYIQQYQRWYCSKCQKYA